MIEISDDDDSFSDTELPKSTKNGNMDPVLLSSDDGSPANQTTDVTELSSDSEDLPDVKLEQRKMAIQNLFAPTTNGHSSDVVKKKSASKVLFPPNNQVNEVKTALPPVETVPREGRTLGVLGIRVTMPVAPYRCQLKLMHKIIQGIKNSENCILESPTGSGKTLALLCSVLAWQQHEQNRVSQEQAKAHAQVYYKDYPQLQREDVTDFIASPDKKTDVTSEKLFSKNQFGEKSIYEKQAEQPTASCSTTSTNKRGGPYMDVDDYDDGGLVSIHKRRRQGSIEAGDNAPKQMTPEKPITTEQKETPEDMRVPTIYYGARTHTQLQQVIKEFKRTAYCGQVKMSLLSSRSKSCIREFNRDQWKSKDDMCRACVKSLTSTGATKRDKDTNCKYYDNRMNLHHGSMPPAFDLEDLIEAGERNNACPYYAARLMAKKAQIVFCPYNYLIDPIIRNSLQISLTGNILVVDEAHNIENICRDTASYQYTQIRVQDALKELEKVAEYRYSNADVLTYIEDLIFTLKSWDDWFTNQRPLINAVPMNNNKAVFEDWSATNFVQTLANHNIGYAQYARFRSHAEQFCTRLREDPRTLLGVTQASGTLLESLAIGLGYLFRDNCSHMEDYKPALESDDNGLLTLNLYCLNPGIVMSELQSTRCIVLASGTLTPMGSFEAELQTPFPQRADPDHVIPPERVWVGTVTGENGCEQNYTAKDMSQPQAAARLGQLLARVCRLTPHGVLCFLPSYNALYIMKEAWRTTHIWRELNQLKHVFIEQRKTGHDEMMKDFYECVGTSKGALLFAVYRGKVSEGMDFKDHQARAVVCVGIPYLNRFETAVKAKMEYNNRNTDKGLVGEKEWMRVQAYRALNQAVGRSIRHKGDWGAVLLVDARYTKDYNTEHLSKWVKNFLGKNNHTYESLQTSPSGLAQFMQRMSAE